MNPATYKITKGNLILDKRFNSYIGKIIRRHFKSLLAHSVDQKIDNASYLIIRNYRYNKQTSYDRTENSFAKAVSDNLPLKLPVSSLKGPSDPPEGCTDCDSGPGGCEESGPDDPSLTCRFCASTIIEENQSLTSQDISSLLPLSEAYDFRDNFLVQYQIGQIYTDYYYEISYLMNALNTININNIDDHIDLGIEMYSIADKLQYGNATDIIITNQFKLKADQMISYYSTVTSNQDFIQILNRISSDLAHFVGMTRQQVLNEI